MTIAQALQLAIDHHHAGRLAEAEILYRKILAAQPAQPIALHMLGLIAAALGQPDQAIALVSQAIAACPTDALFHSNLCKLLTDQRRIPEALLAGRRAMALEPASTLHPYNLAHALNVGRDFAGAADLFQQIIDQDPRHLEARENLVVALEAAGRLDEALAAFRALLALDPENLPALINFAALCKDTGQLDEALACYRRALAIQKDFVPAHSAYLYSLCFHPDSTRASLAREHREFNRHAALWSAIPRPPLPATSGRRVRIGYLSPDLRDHIIGQLLAPILAHHDRGGGGGRFHVSLFDLHPVPADFARQTHAHADAYHPCEQMTDDQIADLIRREKIDILVDLTLHMNRNRILVFARRPAPIQATWLAYPGASGLEAIDYRISDPHLDPGGGCDGDYSERTLRLPHSFWCWQPRFPEFAVAPLPHSANGHVTFGCFNSFGKINAPHLKLWNDLLAMLPTARLAMLSPEGSHRDWVRRQFSPDAAARITFYTPRFQHEYLRLYDLIDVALDTFPYNGHTTSLDALWMGVPVVTLAGDTPVSRAGLSQMTNLGLRELLAQTPEQYLEIARQLAGDESRLANYRATLRDRLLKSAICDVPQFTRDLEALYHRMIDAAG